MLSVYICVFALASIFAVLTVIKPEVDKVSYYICFGIMTLFLAIRFGQGTDYPGYLCIYETASIALNPEIGFVGYTRSIHTEIGWKCLMVLFKMFHADFWLVTALVATATMWFTHLGISEFCKKYRTVALVLLYPTVYLTYYFSGMRQGFAMAVFYGILVSKLLNRKYISYIVGVVLLSTIHTASLIYLIVPIILKIKKKVIIFGGMICGIFGIAMMLEPVRASVKAIGMLFGAASWYFDTVSISWFSLFERIIILSIISILWWDSKEDLELQKRVSPLMKIYIAGFMIYICLCTNSYVSSRLAIMFKMAEFLLIPMLFEAVQTKIRNTMFLFILCLTTLMTYKNLNSYAEGYYKGITAWNYPYVTVFNREDILEYREEFVNETYNFEEHNYLN